VVAPAGTAPAAPAPREGARTWLLIAAAVAIVAGFNLWVLYGGSASLNKPPAFPEGTVVATLTGGDRVTYAPGKLRAGGVVVCEASGIQVGVEVPKPGKTTGEHAFSSDEEHGATIIVQVDDAGRVRARCS
jgi:hypothetical protein